MPGGFAPSEFTVSGFAVFGVGWQVVSSHDWRVRSQHVLLVLCPPPLLRVQDVTVNGDLARLPIKT